VLLALALHAIVIAEISFDRQAQSYHGQQIEVTLALRPDPTASGPAERIARFDQAGAGEQATVDEVTARDAPAPLEMNEPPRSSAPARAESSFRQQERLTTAAAALRAVETAPAQAAQEPSALEGISPEVDRLTQELASLEAEFDEQTRNYARMPRVRRLTSVAARQSVDAAYLLDWRRQVEAVGNKYYPEASIRYGIYGSLRLLVVIDRDGGLHDIRVLSSSGYAVLDEAAIKIVRMAAPYPPFPPELRATTDQLEIIRTWQFQENGLSSN